jgi:hypothetical protein
VSPTGKKVIAMSLIFLLAFPTGLCSLVFTPMGLSSVFGRGDSMGFSQLALMCCAVGWLICGLATWGAVRLIRSANAAPPPDNPTP